MGARRQKAPCAVRVEYKGMTAYGQQEMSSPSPRTPAWAARGGEVDLEWSGGGQANEGLCNDEQQRKGLHSRTEEKQDDGIVQRNDRVTELCGDPFVSLNPWVPGSTHVFSL
jgi:hypothetical protein